ncbi:hypothetical protein Pmar_PMAR029592 [Perkinsus marinus ATCC 50983]|uniref:Uncharacterized protein n=1 Tax=Perkinsus marinus (strain ATCC 50983 / TXsc) TaxID=423536 RepID=C5KWW8_PERM5|nr:hypothetical protein Pmar_PMAR029592 [Perkinsus marinus ATCC 50983]EER10972.1 hypothetical protein Pmar_PMAR029592 [Perkinsus marinus ATCC 50983]|eukprot:XP_002779177.1 hypothetical protein Pmar_PMAR029592 [Perkinsus marinus ATCC 50983]
MAALVCADKLGVGDREIMKEVLRDKLQETPTKALLNLVVKPTTATKLADADEETGTFTRELLLDHVMNILNERAASTEDPMMAVDLLDLWYQHQDRLPNREILRSVVMLALSPEAISVRYMKVIQCIADIGMEKFEDDAHMRKQLVGSARGVYIRNRVEKEGVSIDIWAHVAALLNVEVANGALEEVDNYNQLYRVKEWWECVNNDIAETGKILIRVAHPEMTLLLDDLVNNS